MNHLLFLITVEETPDTDTDTETSEGIHHDYRICVQHAITIYIDSLCSFVLGLTVGQIAGIIIGGLSVVAVASIIIIILLKKNMRLGSYMHLHSI